MPSCLVTRATLFHADHKLYILDAAGNLALTTATPDDFTVHCKAEVLTKFAWTVPTIVGLTMYLRVQQRIIALDIGSCLNGELSPRVGSDELRLKTRTTKNQRSSHE